MAVGSLFHTPTANPTLVQKKEQMNKNWLARAKEETWETRRDKEKRRTNYLRAESSACSLTYGRGYLLPLARYRYS